MKQLHYKKVRPGHWHQTERTGSGPDYSFDYSNQYNKLPSKEMSEIRYSVISKYIPNFSTICDFGYGNGAFINYCRLKNHKTYAYDISEYPPPYGVQRVHDIDELDVDVMTFFDSIEHIEDEDLVSFLNKKRAKYFVISVPWFHEFLGTEWFENWKHRKPNEHFHHFDIHGIIGLLSEANCDIIHLGNEEDQIRKSVDQWPNILTIIAKRK